MSLFRRVARALGSAADEDAPRPPRPQPPVPLVDHRFWFERSKEMVMSSAAAPSIAAERLERMVGWFWTVYTAGAIVGVSLTDKAFPAWAIALIVAPVGSLVLTYWLATWAQSPVYAGFDPRSPELIEAAYVGALETKTFRLKVAAAGTFASAILVILAVVAASIVERDNETAFGFTAAHHASPGANTMAVTGSFPANQKIVFRVRATDERNEGRSAEFAYVSSSSGSLQVAIPVEFDAPEYEVTAEWTEADAGRTMTRSVPRSKGGAGS
jgi:hypothetical protein